MPRAISVGSRIHTSSSAVAERPRDVSCLPVVSFNSTYVERSLRSVVTSGSDLPLRTNQFCSLLLGVVIDAAGGDKRDSLMRGDLCGKRIDVHPSCNKLRNAG